jgi:hypothetical protein
VLLLTNSEFNNVISLKTSVISLGHLSMGQSLFVVCFKKILFTIFLSVGHYKFINLSVRYRTVSSR